MLKESNISTDFSSCSSLTLTSKNYIDPYKKPLDTTSFSSTLKEPKQSIKRFFLTFRKKPKTKTLKHYGNLKTNSTIIGTGASAKVVFIQSSRYKTTLAVKIFNTPPKKSKSSDKQVFMKRLISEFCISSTLDHPNIIKTLDLVLDHKNRYCTVMEHCSGGDLYTFIKEGKLNSPDQVKDYFKQLLDGLSYLHELGVAHRDIKPENLLLFQHATVLKITDFGEADVFKVWPTTERLSEGLCGSTPYIAPEVFSHARRGYGAAQADVWSAGIVLFCMSLNGVPFFCAKPSDSNYRLYLKHYGAYPAFEGLEADIREVLYRMLDPDPETRLSVREVLRLPWLNSSRWGRT